MRKEVEEEMGVLGKRWEKKWVNEERSGRENG
jgi:hypothetical protein